MKREEILNQYTIFDLTQSDLSNLTQEDIDSIVSDTIQLIKELKFSPKKMTCPSLAHGIITIRGGGLESIGNFSADMRFGLIGILINSFKGRLKYQKGNASAEEIKIFKKCMKKWKFGFFKVLGGILYSILQVFLYLLLLPVKMVLAAMGSGKKQKKIEEPLKLVIPTLAIRKQ